MGYFAISKDDLHAVTKACELYGVKILKTEIVTEQTVLLKVAATIQISRCHESLHEYVIRVFYRKI